MIDVSAVDGFYFSLTETFNDNLALPLGQPVDQPAASFNRQAIINAYLPFMKSLAAEGGDAYYDAQCTVGNDQVLLNPTFYLEMSTLAGDSVPESDKAKARSSKLHTVFDDLLKTVFSKDYAAKLNITGDANGGIQSQEYTAEYVEDHAYPDTNLAHPALKFTGKKDSKNVFYAFSPINFCVMTYGSDRKYIYGQVKDSDHVVRFFDPTTESSVTLPADTPIQVGMFAQGVATCDTSTVTAVTKDATGITSITLSSDVSASAAKGYWQFSKGKGAWGSSGQMVFGNYAVFADNQGYGKDSPEAIVGKSLQRDLVTAINRGVALKGYTTEYWNTETNWYPVGEKQNLFSLFMHTGTLKVGDKDVPIFTPPDNPVKCARGTTMTMSYGFAYDETPVKGVKGVEVPAKHDPMPSLVSTVNIIIGAWSSDAPSHTVKFSAGDNGSISPSADQTVIYGGSTAAVTATANTGYVFNGWTGDATGNENPLMITNVTKDMSVKANFIESKGKVTLTMAVSPAGAGSTTPTPSASVDIGVKQEITATAATGYNFDHWQITSGSGSFDADAKKSDNYVTISADATVTAYFASVTSQVTLTMAISPTEAEAAGCVTSPTGSTTVNSGASTSISATAKNGYNFDHWQITSGKGDFGDSKKSETTVTISADATVTAYFTKATAQVTLTMAVSPADAATAGCSTSPTGSSTVNSGASTDISASAQGGYQFSHWDASGATFGDDNKSATNTVKITADTTVTAVFVKTTATYTLTMAVSPTDAGCSTNPTGVKTVNGGQGNKIQAVPGDGYYFADWSVSDASLAKIDNVNSATTYVTLTGDATVTANFAKGSGEAVLTMSVTPDSGGWTDPSVGQHTVKSGESVEIEATANDGCMFIQWQVSDTITIDNTSSSSAIITLSGDGEAKAVFSPLTDTVELTLAVSPEGAGSTNPGAGVHAARKSAPFNISATAATGYYFAGWSSSQNAIIINPYAEKTSVIPTDKSTITANFSANPVEFLACGSVALIKGSEVDTGVTFASNPSVYGLYTDPVKGTTGKKAGLTVVSKAKKSSPLAQVYAEWTKKIMLCNKKNYVTKSSAASANLLKTPIKSLSMSSFDVVYKPSSKNPVVLKRHEALANPSITRIKNAPSKAGDQFTLIGMFFGSKPPTVLVECLSGTDYKYIKCKGVKTPLLYKDAKNKANASCMKVYAADIVHKDAPEAVGYSELLVIYPTLKADQKATGYIIVDNGVGLAIVNTSIED